MLKSINRLLINSDDYLKKLRKNIASVVGDTDGISEESIDRQLNALQRKLIQKANKYEPYNDIANEIFRLRELKEKCATNESQRSEKLKRINELFKFAAERADGIDEFDEELARKLVQKITVYADHFTVEFKSGLEIDV